MWYFGTYSEMEQEASLHKVDTSLWSQLNQLVQVGHGDEYEALLDSMTDSDLCELLQSLELFGGLDKDMNKVENPEQFFIDNHYLVVQGEETGDYVLADTAEMAEQMFRQVFPNIE